MTLDIAPAMGMRAADRLNIRRAAAPEIAWPSEKTGETVHLALLDDTEVVYIDKVESQPREFVCFRRSGNVTLRVELVLQGNARISLATIHMRPEVMDTYLAYGTSGRPDGMDLVASATEVRSELATR